MFWTSCLHAVGLAMGRMDGVSLLVEMIKKGS